MTATATPPAAAPMLALTVQQPWAHAICEWEKLVENRTWRPPARVIGVRIAIHAGLVVDYEGARVLVGRGHMRPGGWAGMYRGAIVCTAIVDGCTLTSTSPWAAPGLWHWLLRDVRRLREPVPARGAQGLWVVPPAIAERVRALEVPWSDELTTDGGVPRA